MDTLKSILTDPSVIGFAVWFAVLVAFAFYAEGLIVGCLALLVTSVSFVILVKEDFYADP